MSSRIERARNLRERVNMGVMGAIASEAVDESHAAALIGEARNGQTVKPGELIAVGGQVFAVSEERKIAIGNDMEMDTTHGFTPVASRLVKGETLISEPIMERVEVEAASKEEDASGLIYGVNPAMEAAESPVRTWEQPEDDGGYSIGDRVLFGVSEYESDLNENVWRPDVRGWHVANGETEE